MSAMTSGRWFILGLLVFGAVSGVLAATVPALRDLPLPALVWPLAASFLADLALMPAVRDGRIAPVSFTERAIGVVGGTLLHMGALALLTPG